MKDELKKIITEITEDVSRLDYVRSDKIPGIDLYMDQVMTFMDDSLSAHKRHPEDKLLTKTMINNYAKSELIPPPVKKKYTKEHIMLLTFIYYFKNLFSINEIDKVLSPLIENYYGKEDDEPFMTELFDQIFSICDSKRKDFRKGMLEILKTAEGMFEGADEGERDYLQMFTFLTLLSQDVYAKLQVMDRLIDTLPNPQKNEKK